MPWFEHAKNYWNLLRFDRVAVKCTLLRFMNHGKNVLFLFFQARCTHKSRDVINFIIVACRIYSRLKWYKNYKNQLRLAKVIVKNKMSRFLWFTVYLVYVDCWQITSQCSFVLKLNYVVFLLIWITMLLPVTLTSRNISDTATLFHGLVPVLRFYVPHFHVYLFDNNYVGVRALTLLFSERSS